MGEPPFKGASLERIDNKKGYYPTNVKWASHKEQARNKRTNKYVTWKGITLCIADWAIKLNIDRSSMSRRLSSFGVCEKSFLKGPHNNIKKQGVYR
jgi:hypothetical protein